jgi:NAD(P)-dependent dehydrogenase (short-subunit alcohol dehydrogenase family)
MAISMAVDPEHLSRPAYNDVVLITHADLDAGYRLARELLRSGYRVAVTSPHTTDLTRILHGYSGNQVFAIAAMTDDQRQYAQVLRRVCGRFGHVDSVIDAGTARSHLLGVLPEPMESRVAGDRDHIDGSEDDLRRCTADA